MGGQSASWKRHIARTTLFVPNAISYYRAKKLQNLNRLQRRTRNERENVQVRKKKQIFAAMSCLGTVLLLMGLVMEWQAAEDFHLQTTGEIGGIMAFIGGVGLIVGLLGFAAARLRE